MPRLKYTAKTEVGKIYNYLKIIEFIPTRIENGKRIMARVKAECLNCKTEDNTVIIEAKHHNVISGIKISCGCATRPGWAYHPYYEIAYRIFTGCNNKNSVLYKDFGAKGVICKFDSVIDFIKYLETLPPRKKGDTLKRIDLNRPHEIGNLYWKEGKERTASTRKSIDLLSISKLNEEKLNKFQKVFISKIEEDSQIKHLIKCLICENVTQYKRIQSAFRDYCSKCPSHILNSSGHKKRYTLVEITQFCIVNKITYVDDYYNNSTEPHNFICNNNHKYISTIAKIKISLKDDNTGCQLCAINSCRFSLEEIKDIFLKRNFLYLENSYINVDKNVQTKCLKCNFEWSSLISSVIRGVSGCPKCNAGENQNYTFLFLREIFPTIEIFEEFRIDIPKNELQYKYIWADFYFELNNGKFIVEYNGPQHYQSMIFGHQTEAEALNCFIIQQKRDNWLFNYCKDNNINLISIDGRENINIKIRSLLLNYFNKQEPIGLIAAVDLDKVIGYDNTIPWKEPKDIKKFRELTAGSILICGRKTYESLPTNKLPSKIKFVISSDPESFTKYTNTFIFSNLEEAIAVAQIKNIPIWIIGGTNIYKEALEKELVDIIDLSILNYNISDKIENLDPSKLNYFPEIPSSYIILNEFIDKSSEHLTHRRYIRKIMYKENMIEVLPLNSIKIPYREYINNPKIVWNMIRKNEKIIIEFDDGSTMFLGSSVS